MDIETSRKYKFEFIGIPENDTITDEFLDTIYNKFVETKQQNEIKPIVNRGRVNITKTSKVKKPKFEKAENNSERYQLTLRFLNDLLVAINKPKITEITQFQKIKRSDLITEPCSKVLNEYMDEIVKMVGKKHIFYQNRKQYSHYIGSV